ncbi:cytoskeletal protein CcmA (bactofilin family) [Desulfobotulus alkaliphilus]|uniref:Cytoskeletal protein CcmA (Bactofilin family) n=1 Tax=Desulfobotulus alkaliphilus TaxID=622671 RepID=A0A562RT73_9BACT|nr:polymer-forming cytoskeletal protein [Desulfobotulus alkaliphilus]TWI71774.1 cytoskeletal protein CcmA (bactofilin family) [Desulfobotulus alkaliphilus]
MKEKWYRLFTKGTGRNQREVKENTFFPVTPLLAGNQRRAQVGKVKNLSIIDSDLRVEGVLNAKGRLVIKGMVKGTISGASVIIAEEGRVYCDATVEELTIGGVFEGNIQARERVVILATGKCAGTVTCKDLVVESGGILNAEVTCTRERKDEKGLLEEKPKEKQDEKTADEQPLDKKDKIRQVL